MVISFLGAVFIDSRFTSLAIFFLFLHKEKSVDGRRVNHLSTLSIVQSQFSAGVQLQYLVQSN